MATAVVPGYPNLRYVGGAAAKPAEQRLQPGFLALLQRAASSLGVVFDIFSGSGGPSVRGGGFAGDPHSQGIGADISVRGAPVGNYPGAVDTLHSVGLRSGATDFTYQGKADPAHVDTLSTSTRSGTSAPSSIRNVGQFFGSVLNRLGLPDTAPNRLFLIAWSTLEGTKAKNNPLATTYRNSDLASAPLPGNSAGVQQYATPEAGVTATARTLQNYPNILGLFRKGNAVQASFGVHPGVDSEFRKWSGGGYGLDKVRLAAQGNPSGKSAADIGSTDLGLAAAGTAAKDAALAVPRFLSKITDTHNILRGLQVVAGAVLVLVGVTLLARQVGLAADVPKPPVAIPVPVP